MLPAHHATFHGQYDARSALVTITMSLALYNALELLLLIFTTFTKWRGLYFWSLVVSSFGVMGYCTGLLVEYFKLANVLVGLVQDNIGWMCMITGQSLVLYSRLGLIVSNRKITQAVKWMIIVDAVVFHTITTVLNFGARYGGGEPFIHGYFYIENIQMTCFCVQEFIISAIYVYHTIALLKVISKQRTRMVRWQLFTINIIIVVLDIVLLVIQYKNLHIYEQSVKAFVYSVKLKLEFAILGKLVDLVQKSQRTLSNALGTMDDCVEPTASSPTRERTLSPGSSMPWMRNRDKLPIQHIEHKENGSLGSGDLNGGFGNEDLNGGFGNNDLKPGQHDSDEKTLSPGSVSSGPRQKGRESDIMYADFMRSMSE